MGRRKNYYKQVDYEMLQDWFMKREPTDNYIWKKDWWRNNAFMRDRLIQLFSDSYEIVGSHYSKSIECPVIKTTYKGVEIVWQYNFYDWQIMVKSEKPLVFENLSIFNADGDYLFYQGIPKDYQFKKYSEENNKEFAIDIYSNDPMEVFPFALELRRVIDRAYN